MPWTLKIGAHTFGFRDNKLVSVSVHSATSADAHLKEGIGFKSSPADIEKAFGKPTRERNSTRGYELEEGYVLEFHFIRKGAFQRKGNEGAKLITIRIHHPDAGR
jgi:hypothetical protein